MFVKEDLILPQHYTFFDFIVTKVWRYSPVRCLNVIDAQARGKSGPLFIFEMSDDVVISANRTVAREEAHIGKARQRKLDAHRLIGRTQVLLRSWYERNKHIFPASRWEPYDPEKKWEKYTMTDTPSRNV